MNNLAETVWHENPVILGAIAGSGKFRYKLDQNDYFRDLNPKIFSFFSEYRSWKDENPVLLTRSIDSLTDEEKIKWAEIHRFTPIKKDNYQTDEGFWEMVNFYLEFEIGTNLSASTFLYLLSIGIWTGSKEGVEGIDG